MPWLHAKNTRWLVAAVAAVADASSPEGSDVTGFSPKVSTVTGKLVPLVNLHLDQ